MCALHRFYNISSPLESGIQRMDSQCTAHGPVLALGTAGRGGR